MWECHHVSSIAVLSLREFLHCNVTAPAMALKRAARLPIAAAVEVGSTAVGRVRLEAGW
jgi:hypothetical protein